VVVPLVNDREEAAKAAGACRYPPLGYRSWGPNRVMAYAGSDYFERANEEIICLVQFERIEAAANLEEIASVPGIDGFWIGPADLAISLGLTPSAEAKEDPRHIEACQNVLEVARAHGLIAGRAVSDAQEAARRFQEGYNFCPLSSDMRAIRAGTAAAIEEFRGLIA
jgi:4-hydroxy-2-oxoheptanedioate aldolase